MKPLILLLCLSILPFAFGSSDSAVDSSVAPTVKKFLDIEKVKKVSYLLASGRGFGQSSFGHSYLRFSYDENKFSEDDITIEFIADAPPSELNYLRGIGIGENYNLAVVPSDYKNVYRYHVIGEDRDLTSYVLNLSNHDIRALSSKINELIANGSGMTYSFFLRNCAAMVSEVFEESLEITFNGPNSVIPVFIPHKLKKKGMIKTIHTDPRVSTLRENVVAEKLKDISVEAIEFQNIRKQLASQDFGERLLGLYKLQNYREDHYDQRPLDIKLRSLGGNIIKYESKLVKNQMRPFFSAKKDFFSAVKVDDVVVTPHVRSIKSVKFAVHGDKVYITAKLRILAHHKKDGPRKLMSAKRVLPGFRFKDGIIYNPDGEIFAYRLSTDVLDAEFYSPGVYVGAELAKVKHNKVVHFTILEENAFEPLKRNYTDRDLMAVDNGDGVKGGGYCYSHSVLNRMLKHQVIFDPTSVPLYLNMRVPKSY